MPVKKAETKVVDNLRTQLEELAESLDKLYITIQKEMTRLCSEFDEINSVLIEGFRNVVEKKAPIDVVPDAVSEPDDSGYVSSDDDQEDNRPDDQDDTAQDSCTKEDVDKLVNMINSWSARGAI